VLTIAPVAKANPLKQGLKHQHTIDRDARRGRVAKANPLKQGLKQGATVIASASFVGRKGQSTKTRIETKSGEIKALDVAGRRKGQSTKTRIETGDGVCSRDRHDQSQRPIH